MSDKERNELAEVIRDTDLLGCGCCGASTEVQVGPDEWDVDYPAREEALASKLLAAGYRKPRAITTVEELDALPYGTAVAHDEGWGITVAQRHAEDLRWYVTGCLEYIRPEALLPATTIAEASL